MKIVKVLVKDPEQESGYRILAQLEEKHAQQYIADITSDFFDQSMLNAINLDRSPLQERAERVTALKKLIDNALFTSGFILEPILLPA